MKWLPVALLLTAALLVHAQEAAIEGRAVYAAEACWQCHVHKTDKEFPELRGTLRTGPVIGATRVPRSAEWHLAHFYAPRALAPESQMPAYKRRFTPHPNEAELRALVERHGGDDGIVTEREYDGDWAAALKRFDSGNGVLSLADAAPVADSGMTALVDYLLRSEPEAPPQYREPVAGPSHDAANAIERGGRLYARHCAGCHGENGNGAGPVAMFFGDHPPRNFLRGEYKFRSTESPDPPLDSDLFRTIRRGAGGSMPAWPDLTDRQVWDLVVYLKALHPGYLPRELFIEGDAEHAFVADSEDEVDTTGVVLEYGRVSRRAGTWYWNDRPITDGMEVHGYRFRLGKPVYGWMEAFEPRPPVEIGDAPFFYSDESADRGAKIYEELSCGKCHGPEGRGDGDSANQTRGPLGQAMVPSDYTQGFKGGGDARSLVRTFLTGLHGTPMPAYGTNFEDRADAWHLAHYVMRQAKQK